MLLPTKEEDDVNRPFDMNWPWESGDSIHIATPKPASASQIEKVSALRELVQKDPNYLAHEHIRNWTTEQQLTRFLIARNYNVAKAHDLMTVAIEWRVSRNVDSLRADNAKEWEARMSHEAETGKIYLPGYDRWGRPVIIFDNTVQNTKSAEDQLAYLAWNLEQAIALMPKHVDKYLIFMHLNKFSIFNCPPMRVTAETISMLCSTYPERLGHVVCYQPPTYFLTFYNTVKGLLDPKTRSKVIFLSGNVEDGSENDRQMRELIGDKWKQLTGAAQPVLRAGSSPGFIHEEYWAYIMNKLQRISSSSSSSSSLSATTPNTPSTMSSEATLSSSSSSFVCENNACDQIPGNIPTLSQQSNIINKAFPPPSSFFFFIIYV